MVMLHPVLTANQSILAELCRRHHVLRLEAFGSSTRKDFDDSRSDFDFLVDFDPGHEDYFDAFFGLKEEFETVLGRPVDLVSINSVTNPYFIRRIAAERELLYAA